jgi:hypothetical protein
LVVGGGGAEAERDGKARVFLSGLILAGLLAGAAMLPDNKHTDAITTHHGGSAQVGPLHAAAADSGGENETAKDAVDSAGTQDRRYFPGRMAM